MRSFSIPIGVIPFRPLSDSFLSDLEAASAWRPVVGHLGAAEPEFFQRRHLSHQPHRLILHRRAHAKRPVGGGWRFSRRGPGRPASPGCRARPGLREAVSSSAATASAGTALIRAADAAAFQLRQVFQASGSLVGEPGMGKPQPAEMGTCEIARSPSSFSGVKWKLTFSSFFRAFRCWKPVPLHWRRGQPQDPQLGQARRCVSGRHPLTGVKVRLSSRRPVNAPMCCKPSP